MASYAPCRWTPLVVLRPSPLYTPVIVKPLGIIHLLPLYSPWHHMLLAVVHSLSLYTPCRCTPLVVVHHLTSYTSSSLCTPCRCTPLACTPPCCCTPFAPAAHMLSQNCPLCHDPYQICSHVPTFYSKSRVGPCSAPTGETSVRRRLTWSRPMVWSTSNGRVRIDELHWIGS